MAKESSSKTGSPNRSGRMRLNQLPANLHKYLHPIYRRMLIQARQTAVRHRSKMTARAEGAKCKIVRRSGKTRHTAASRLHPFLFRRTAAQAIVKKYATMEVKPRIPLFCCSRCGMVTRRANNIRGHDCTLRKGLTFWRGTGAGASAQLNSVGDNEIDDELLALASRNKIRDGLAIMERTGWPQNIAVDEIEQETITEECLERPGPSRILTLRAMSSVVLASPSSSSSDSASSASSSGSSSSRSSISVDEAFEQRRARIVSKRAIGRARLLSGRACGSCGDLFASFADYDAHLGDDVANPDPVCGRLPPCPVPIAINDCSTIPVEYDFVRRRAREHSPRRMKIGACTSCGEREFETMPELHDHIVSCARKSLQARMAAATKGGGRK